jgi:hypothetical protein
MTRLKKHLEELQNTDNFWNIDYYPPETSNCLISDSRWKTQLLKKKEKLSMPLSNLQWSTGLYCFWLFHNRRVTALYGGKSCGNLAQRIKAGPKLDTFAYYTPKPPWWKEDQIFVSYSTGSIECEPDMIKTLAPVFNKQHNPYNETFFLNVQAYHTFKAEVEEARIKHARLII